MKFIIRDTDYAIRAVIFMASYLKKNPKKKTFTVGGILERVDLPERFLRRILQKLAKKGVLRSYKGKEGGFSFAKDPKKIKLIDVIEVFQGKVDLTNCVLRKKPCPNIKICKVRKKFKNIGKMVNRELDKITIDSLI